MPSPEEIKKKTDEFFEEEEDEEEEPQEIPTQIVDPEPPYSLRQPYSTSEH